MSDQQYTHVYGKEKLTFVKRGHNYTRKGYDIRVETAERFAKKCSYMGEPEGRTVEKLIEAFIRSSGWGPNVKQAPVFEPNVNEHVKEAVERVGKDVWFG